MERQVAGRRDYYPLSIPLPRLVLSRVITMIEEAGFLRKFVKTLGHDSVALSLGVPELREKSVSPSLHGTWLS